MYYSVWLANHGIANAVQGAKYGPCVTDMALVKSAEKNQTEAYRAMGMFVAT